MAQPTDKERISALERELGQIHTVLKTVLAELRQRGLKDLPAAPSKTKPVKMTEAARKAQLREQAALMRERRWPKAKKKTRKGNPRI